MTTLVVGASGATGRLVVEKLLDEGEDVKIIVRSTDNLSDAIKRNKHMTITQAVLLDLTDEQLKKQVSNCRAVVSCLGHNMNLKGVYGRPRRLVKDGVQRLCEAIKATSNTDLTIPVKFILMNSTGNQNNKNGETVSLAQSLTIGLIRLFVPPHADNEEAAAYLQAKYGENQQVIEWSTVRPDSLINSPLSTEYDVYERPTRSAIFDAGKTSRVNVAHFMSQLIVNPLLWKQWKTKMPVIYNK